MGVVVVAASSPILVILKAHLSSIGLLPNEEEGEGRGRDPVMKMDSDRGVWLPPRPLEGGTPTIRVGAFEALAEEVASSVDMIDSTSSIHISTFSGFRSGGEQVDIYTR